MPSVTRTAVKPLRGGVGWELSGGEEWTPEAVSVEWDGTSAAGDFVVAVSYYNDGGALIDRAFPEGVTNSPGDTGRTFFRPFKRSAGGGSDPDAIRYGIVNSGEFLEVRTVGPGGGEGFYFLDTSGNGFFMQSTSFMQLIADPFQVISSGEISMNVGAAPSAAAFVIGLNAVGCKFELVNHLGQALLRVTENGTYHIKTGAAWVADL